MFNINAAAAPPHGDLCLEHHAVHSASIIIQLLTTVSPQLEALKKEESGRVMLNQYTRYLTVVLAAFQAYGIVVGLEGAGNVVADQVASSASRRLSL